MKNIDPHIVYLNKKLKCGKPSKRKVRYLAIPILYKYINIIDGIEIEDKIIYEVYKKI